MTAYRYGKTLTEASPADGVTGFILRNVVDGSYFFRVYRGKRRFTDYDLRHDDLEVTISPDAMAAFYRAGKLAVLDHSPAVLGLKKAGRSRKRTRPALKRKGGILVMARTGAKVDAAAAVAAERGDHESRGLTTASIPRPR